MVLLTAVPVLWSCRPILRLPVIGGFAIRKMAQAQIRPGAIRLYPIREGRCLAYAASWLSHWPETHRAALSVPKF